MTAGACIACGATEWEPLHRVLLRCGRCGFVRAAESPTHDSLARLYADGYFHGEEYADYLGDAPAHAENFRRRLARLHEVAGRIESMYEVGCAYGLWLQTLRAGGVRASGIDISSEAVRHAAGTLGLDAALGRFDQAALDAGAYQAFCMWDTIEHLADPEVYVAKMARLLPEGGWLFLTTGDIGSALARHQGEHWRMIHPPTHLQYFSRETISRFLARHGLRVVSIESVSMCRSVYGTLEGARRFASGATRAAARVLSRLVPQALSRHLRFSVDLGDIMLVCARKHGDSPRSAGLQGDGGSRG